MAKKGRVFLASGKDIKKNSIMLDKDSKIYKCNTDQYFRNRPNPSGKVNSDNNDNNETGNQTQTGNQNQAPERIQQGGDNNKQRMVGSASGNQNMESGERAPKTTEEISISRPKVLDLRQFKI